MNKFTKFFKKNKKSILSVALASLLTFSFNYSPISLFADWAKDKVNAYKSSNLQTYYANTSTTSESKIAAGSYPKELEEYFKNSSNNFNILTFYDTRYTTLFAEHVHKFFSENSDVEFVDKYEKFLASKNKETIYDYYEADKTFIKTIHGCETFISYVEHFAHNGTSDKDGSVIVKALFTHETNYRSEFYCALANKMKSENENVPTINDLYDRLPTNMKENEFYEHSYSYERVKTVIDNKIIETVAIYSYDGTTQNNNVAGIIANEAPITSDYFYGEGYVSENTPKVEYETVSYTSSNTKITARQVYYLGAESDVSGKPGYNSNYFRCSAQSLYDESPLQFRKIQNGETGYISGKTTYYKYAAMPFETSNEKYVLYVKDDNGVTSDEKATYDSLFINVITQADIDADQKNANDLLASDLYKYDADTTLHDLYFYVQIPYTEQNFKTVTNFTSEKSFQNFCNTFAPDGQSKLYLKVKTNESYVVYIDDAENEQIDIDGVKKDATAANFLLKYPGYSYKVVDVDFALGTDELGNPINRNDYFEVTTSYSNYYKTDVKLFFKKIKTYYSDIVTTDDVYQKDGANFVYETTESPKISYETVDVPAETYEVDGGKRVLYALSDEDNITINSVVYDTVSQATLDDAKNRNFYVEVTDAVYADIYGTAERTTKFFFKHQTESVKQIYVLDDTKKASENEVYKNLNYKVLTTEEYKTSSNFKNFVKITSTDENYNKNFTLYYRYDIALDADDIFVQNSIKKSNAVYVIDDSLTYSDKSAYSLNLYTVLTTDEFNADSDFYVQITENDENYSTLYTKLYYKYQATNAVNNKLYLYSSAKSDKYETFYSTDKDYVARDYKIVESNDPNYVEGLELYYKKIRTEKTVNKPLDTYFYYKTSSAVTLSANSYYVVSFYANTTGENVEASFYLTDASKVLDEIKLEHISTNGKWQKFVMFIATDALNQSSVSLTMYMGDKNSILGSHASDTSIKSISGSVLFDDMAITTINQTDFAKLAIDEKVVEETLEFKKNEEDTDPHTIDVVIANTKTVSATDSTLLFPNKYDYRTKSDIAVKPSGSWDDLFNFESAELENRITSSSLPVVDENTDGFTPYEKDSPYADDYWHYYISRDVSGQGNNFVLSQYQDAYIAGNLVSSIVAESTIDKTVKLDEDEEEKEEDKDDDKEDEEVDDDVPYLQNGSTFQNNNHVLKLENKNRLVALGVESNKFTLKQFEYYKITVWVFATDKEANATITLNSVLSTSTTPTYGSLTTKSVTANACLSSYSKKVTNEYSWIPLSIYVEGNTLHNQDCTLVLSASKNSVVYFDNITIENISSSAYDTASSDSDEKTQVVSLTPSTSVVSNGITNGYFNNIVLKENYKTPDYDYYAPKAVKNWTANSNNSSNVIAGVVPTSDAYTKSDNTNTLSFYNKYNNQNIPYSKGFSAELGNSYNNVYGIYAPATKDSTIADAYETNLATKNTYKIYSSSISLSASSVYDVSVDFQKAYQFNGYMVITLYYGSVDANKVISQIKLHSDDIHTTDWQTYHFFVATSTTSASVYLEIGIESATGTCFYKDAAAVTTTKTLEELKNQYLVNDNVAGSENNLFEKEDYETVRFLNLSMLNSSIHSNDKNENSNTYEVKEYTNKLINNKKYTVGQSGVAVATYYNETSVDSTYTVTIDKVTYYIGKVVDESNNETFHLYKYNDCLPENEVTEIDGKPVKVESFKKVVVGSESNETEYTSTETKKSNYLYTFEDDVTINNVNIPASELTNRYSENVLILANSYSTDYITIEPAYTSTLNKSSFLVLKVYVKTSDFVEDDYGLNITISSISTQWTKVNTTTVTGDAVDEEGFVCYQTLIKTGESSITSFGVSFSLGTDAKPCAGYAIVAGIALETYSNEDAFDHYAATVEDDETTVKKFYKNSKTSETDEEETQDEESVTWATFFYIFSSLLLVLVMVIAMVAVYFKKHPIKKAIKVQNEHEKDIELIQTTKKVDTKKEKIKEVDDDSEGIV